MPYLCSYIPRDPASKNPLGEVRILTRGFACTQEELPREIATACRAKPGSLAYEWICSEAVDAWQEHYRANGSRVYMNREGFDE